MCPLVLQVRVCLMAEAEAVSDARDASEVGTYLALRTTQSFSIPLFDTHILRSSYKFTNFSVFSNAHRYLERFLSFLYSSPKPYRHRSQISNAPHPRPT